MPDFESWKEYYDDANQGHVFEFWDTLDIGEQASLLKTLATIDPMKCNRTFERSTAPVSGSNATITPLPESIYGSLVDSNQDQKNSWNEIGLNSIARNQVAVILLAGGQGTRLGSSAPKGCYDIQLPSHKSLFQLQAERILKLQTLAKKHDESESTPIIPWYIMTSGPTRKPTEDFFQSKNYFGLLQQQIIFFEQGVLPAFTKDGKFILETKSEISVAPDGNGGIYAALKSAGVLVDLEKRGILYVHAYCVDNCLVKVADPVFIGFCIERQCEIGAKSVVKQNPTEPVGIICVKNGKYAVVEYSEIDQSLSELVNTQGQLVHRFANIANHFYTVQFLKSIEKFENQLEYHVASKKIKHVNASGEQVTPKTPNGIKLELFIFDVFPFASKFAVLESLREEEFSPLKNASGCKDGDSPETSRSDILKLHAKFAIAAGAIVPSGELEISPLVSYAGEGLESNKGQIIESALLE